MISELGDKIYLTVIKFNSWWWEVDSQRDELARLILTICVPSLLLVWYKWMFYYTKKSKIPLPPGPYGLPIVGYLPFFGSNVHEIFTSLAHKYGPIYSLRLGTKLHVIVNSIEYVKIVVREQDQVFANRNSPITAVTVTYGGMDIVWSDSNPNWKNMRRILASQVLSNTNLNTFKSFRRLEVRKLVNEVYTKLGANININQIAFNTSLNIVTSMLWGYTKPFYDLEEFRHVEFKIIELLGAPNLSDYIPILSWFDLQGFNRDMKKQFKYMDQIFNTMIEEKYKVKNKRNGTFEEGEMEDTLQTLLDLKDKIGDPKTLDLIHIKALLLNIVVGATDTTSTMVEWAMAEILNSPRVMKKIQEELREVIGMNNIVEESHLPKLTYLDAVVKETFRLHPPLPLLIQRSPHESCIVAGYSVPKETILYINVWAIHRDPKNWENPLEFKPERFLNSKWDYNGNNLKFLPFGSGRRICPGMAVGDKMLNYILASLLHSFDWSLPKDEELQLSDEFGIVVKKRIPLIAIPSQRLSSESLYN
ncbi:cytochrome P450 71AU50-like [Rutidosis leptorrhynchoides]|uniref:cytochrome P450 71AU50-like n=1 Tax=Rutidosis leptorrhynchoides TaxID=125765 RepID=UPI003A98E806